MAFCSDRTITVSIKVETPSESSSITFRTGLSAYCAAPQERIEFAAQETLKKSKAEEAHRFEQRSCRIVRVKNSTKRRVT